MTDRDYELIGPEPAVAMMQRGLAMRRILRNDPRFSSYGRIVYLIDPEDDAEEVMMALAGVQGAGNSHFFPKSRVDAAYARFEAAGFVTDRHEHFIGYVKDSAPAARAILSAHAMPSDLEVVRIGPDTPHALLVETADLMQSCGVMPVPGRAMRGALVPGIVLVAMDKAGAVVATAASFLPNHPKSARPAHAFWGMLATRPDRRGQKIALILGAQAMLHMAETHGALSFSTGVRADNGSSQALCHKLAVRDSDWVFGQCLNPALVGGGRLTK